MSNILSFDPSRFEGLVERFGLKQSWINLLSTRISTAGSQFEYILDSPFFNQANVLEISAPADHGVLVANLRRVQESLRSLEEFGKLVDVSFAAAMKHLRYRSYVVEQLLVGAGVSESDAVRSRLQRSRLYVLITESQCRQSWRDTVRLVLEGGADVLQLREKHLGDGELLRRAEWMCAACAEAGALFVMNDRPDLAVLSGAAGVHVGQEELGGAACRRIVGAAGLIGISTHGVLQFREAIAVGADYAGVGPVFPSTTKQFMEFPGLDYVTAVAEVSLLQPPVTMT